MPTISGASYNNDFVRRRGCASGFPHPSSYLRDFSWSYSGIKKGIRFRASVLQAASSSLWPYCNRLVRTVLAVIGTFNPVSDVSESFFDRRRNRQRQAAVQLSAKEC